jgi:hypothetical protein
MPATVFSSAKHAAVRQHRTPARWKRLPSQQAAAHRNHLRSPFAKPSYVLASVRIPFRNFAAISDEAPLAAVPQDSMQTGSEQRLPRQVPLKTAALQGAITHPAGRGIIGAIVSLTNRATGMTRTLSTDADGVFRWSDLAREIIYCWCRATVSRILRATIYN